MRRLIAGPVLCVALLGAVGAASPAMAAAAAPREGLSAPTLEYPVTKYFTGTSTVSKEDAIGDAVNNMQDYAENEIMGDCKAVQTTVHSHPMIAGGWYYEAIIQAKCTESPDGEN
ncbi:hypothetical protein AB0N17_44025 [Streptomyces sp. NPDC051133]|uniref:hypothetical protein n=1 Tax=Streptomyces sp. NPDC051133 TaxID=3155521 RepID=UPI003432C2BD